MRRVRVGNQRGMMLIVSYLVLALLFVYANTITLWTFTQRLAANRLRDRYQALDLAQGAMEQLREDLHRFLTEDVYAQGGGGLWSMNDAIQALAWLDNLDTQSEVPRFDFPMTDTNGDGVINWVDGTDGLREGTSDHPRMISLASGQGSAWITDIASTDLGNPLAARRVTIEAQADIGSITKRIRATYEISLGMADIFRNAYFVNNLGWFDAPGGSQISIRGEIRSNGDLTFSGDMNDLKVLGDLYAARNPELINPATGMQATGTIFGNPSEYGLSTYWMWKGDGARPARRLTFEGQPPLGGEPKILEYGVGFDTEPRPPSQPPFPEQQRFQDQPTHPIPYLGDLSYYTSLSTQMHGSLRYNVDADGDGIYGESGEPSPTIDAFSTDPNPLVLYGTWYKPIQINGPVVIPGDVIIRGWVEGQGTIYAGRNLHIVGEVKYKNKPVWPILERNVMTGQIREACKTTGATSDLGTVCANGAYYQPGADIPPDCRTAP